MFSYSIYMVLLHVVYPALVFVLGFYLGKKSIKSAKDRKKATQ